MDIDIDKAVAAELAREAQTDQKSISAGVTINDTAVEATLGAHVGEGWSIAAMWRRFRGTTKNEAAIGITKEF